MENIQKIYINLDDSGKLSNKEIVCVYGGIIFTSKKQKDKFITQYKSIINDIKCHYCKVCNKVCPEIKNTNIKMSHKRRVMNYLKKYSICALVIKNENVYNYIKNNKALDYPVGLITADEVAMAGGKYESSNITYYLYTKQDYWTGSPSNFNSSGSAIESIISSTGDISRQYLSLSIGACPVVFLSSKAKLSGSGTYDDVYTVS